MKTIIRLIPLVLMAALALVGSGSRSAVSTSPRSALLQSGFCLRFDAAIDNCVIGSPPEQCSSTYNITSAYQAGDGLNTTQNQSVPCLGCGSTISDIPTATESDLL